MTVRREASNRADVKVITEEVSLDQSASSNENKTLRRDLINEADIALLAACILWRCYLDPDQAAGS